MIALASDKDSREISLKTLALNMGITPEFILSAVRDGIIADKKANTDYSARYKYIELGLMILEMNPKDKKEADEYEWEDTDYARLSDDELEREYGRRVEALRRTVNR